MTVGKDCNRSGHGREMTNLIHFQCFLLCLQGKRLEATQKSKIEEIQVSPQACETLCKFLPFYITQSFTASNIQSA